MLPSLIALAAISAGPHTFDGRHDISTIDLTIVYLVPKDREPLADWRERVDYYAKRIDAFHTRESSSASKLQITIHPTPLILETDTETLRGKNPNETFFNSTREAADALKWRERKKVGFPIILVLGEINWRELDDFTRTRMVDGKPVHEGNLSPEGRHFPGAESGGARAIYDARRGLGMGLVSADGWRVPYSGSDCVVYHEGVGHAIGLPHPEPADKSVMCFAQYHFWINQAWVTPSQKKALGWDDNGGTPIDRSKSNDLFTAFTALQAPIKPKVGQPVDLALTWPEGCRVRSLKVRTQTEMRGPWAAHPVKVEGAAPSALSLGAFDRATPVSYRVDAELEDGQSVEIRGYFQVAPAG